MVLAKYEAENCHVRNDQPVKFILKSEQDILLTFKVPAIPPAG